MYALVSEYADNDRGWWDGVFNDRRIVADNLGSIEEAKKRSMFVLFEEDGDRLVAQDLYSRDSIVLMTDPLYLEVKNQAVVEST